METMTTDRINELVELLRRIESFKTGDISFTLMRPEDARDLLSIAYDASGVEYLKGYSTRLETRVDALTVELDEANKFVASMGDELRSLRSLCDRVQEQLAADGSTRRWWRRRNGVGTVRNCPPKQTAI